jgi:hypothetical protein
MSMDPPSTALPNADKLLTLFYNLNLWVKAATLLIFFDLYCALRFDQSFFDITGAWIAQTLSWTDAVLIGFGLWTILAVIAPILREILFATLGRAWWKWGRTPTTDDPTDASTSYIRADVLRMIAAENNNTVQFDLYREHQRNIERDRDMMGQMFSLASLMLFSRYLGSADAPTLIWQLSEFAAAPRATLAESAVALGLWSLVFGLVGVGLYRGVISPPYREWIDYPIHRIQARAKALAPPPSLPPLP